MWYVIQVKALHEIRVAEKCRKDVIIPGEDAFVFLSEKYIRKGGVWEIKSIPTFQKYIFVETADVSDFRYRLRAVREMTKFLGSGDEVIPIYPEEEDWLRRLGGPEHLIAVSEATYKGQDLVITRGPMEGLEGKIRWVNSRQKTVGVGVSLLGKEQVIKVAMEFVDPPKIIETGNIRKADAE